MSWIINYTNVVSKTFLKKSRIPSRSNRNSTSSNQKQIEEQLSNRIITYRCMRTTSELCPVGNIFLHKLKSNGAELREIREKSASSIRRTLKDCNRCAVDLSLEQRQPWYCILHEGNCCLQKFKKARIRWSLTMNQRALALTERRSFPNLEAEDDAFTQCRPSRIRRSNQLMAALSEKKNYESCNPFGTEALSPLVNVAAGLAAPDTTEVYTKYNATRPRFLQSIKHTRVQNFAAQITEKKARLPTSQMAKTSAENQQDMFVRLIIVTAEKTSLDLHKGLSYPVPAYPMSLPPCDGSHAKTKNSAFLKNIASLQTETII